jgi:uncharacterized protein YndB with AHSA1/START domain
MDQLFDFSVDKDAHTIYITREFAADIDLVWDAFTKAEILDLWMAPKPWRLKTKDMDFREGGRWLYAMVSTENVSRYSLAEFVKIDPKSSFTSRNSFSDENGHPINAVYSLTTNSFTAGEGKTTLRIVKKMPSLAVLEQFIAGGMYKEGMAMGMRNLDELLFTLVTKK